MKFLCRLLLLCLFGWGSVFAQSNLPACQGSETSMWSNCFGTFTFANREKYVGEFTAEFTKEINDYLKTELNITYSAAVALVGAANIDGVILSVAGADGNFVG